MLLRYLHCDDVLSSELYQEDVATSVTAVQQSSVEMAHHADTRA